MDKRTELLEKLDTLINRDLQIKKVLDGAQRDQQQLNQDIAKFIEGELGLQGPATLLDISKKLLEQTIEPSRIVAP